MVGHPKHVAKALAQGVDVICAQGGEGGGHTGETPFSVLIPAVVDLCKDAKSPLTGEPVIVVAAGGIGDGRGLAAALSYGAAGVWVGTRFVASEEAGAPKIHKELVLSAGYDDISRTLIYSGRPMLTLLCLHSLGKTGGKRRFASLQVRARSPTKSNWRGIQRSPLRAACVRMANFDVGSMSLKSFIGLMGKVAGAIKDIKPAKDM